MPYFDYFVRSLLSFIDIEFLAANSKNNEKIPNARICHEMDLQSFMVLKKKLFSRCVQDGQQLCGYFGYGFYGFVWGHLEKAILKPF